MLISSENVLFKIGNWKKKDWKAFMSHRLHEQKLIILTAAAFLDIYLTRRGEVMRYACYLRKGIATYGR